jgi:hypothetical protein
MDDVVEMVLKVKWDTHAQPERQNDYVDRIHQRFLELMDGLEQV